MGNFANALFSTLLGWLKNAAAWLWSFFSSQANGGFVVWVAEHWLPLVLLLCAVCIAIDLVVNFFRWQPYKVWASFFRRLTGRDDEQVDTGRVRRRWIHADGTTSIEEIDLAEAPPEPVPTEPYTAALPEDVSARYAQYARPQPESEPEVPAPIEPSQPEPVGAPSHVSAPRRRRFTGDEELPLHYTPPIAHEDTPAYHEPYYPPQWKRPTDAGSSSVNIGGGL